MKTLIYSSNELSLRFRAVDFWRGSDHRILASSSETSFDYLVFLDSRGFSGDWDLSLGGRLMRFFEAKRASYLMIIRPLELTTWGTLANFVTLNDISFCKLITNMGFVDHTPKKHKICQNVISQAEAFSEAHCCLLIKLEKFKTSRMEEVDLYNIEYTDPFINKLSQILRQTETIILNTPDISEKIILDRPRPDSFYLSVKKGNEFNSRLPHKSLINFGEFDSQLTYDAVHYTTKGNDLVFNSLEKYL